MDEKTTVRRWGTNPRLRITRAMLSPLSYRGAVFPSTFWRICFTTRTNPGSVSQRHHSQTMAADVEHPFCRRRHEHVIFLGDGNWSINPPMQPEGINVAGFEPSLCNEREEREPRGPTVINYIRRSQQTTIPRTT
mgnify:CR=1 FL=1